MRGWEYKHDMFVGTIKRRSTLKEVAVALLLTASRNTPASTIPCSRIGISRVPENR